MRRSPYCARSCFVPVWPGFEMESDRRGAMAAETRLADGRRGSVPAVLRRYRVGERNVAEDAGHAAARPLSAHRVDDAPGGTQCTTSNTAGPRLLRIQHRRHE